MRNIAASRLNPRTILWPLLTLALVVVALGMVSQSASAMPNQMGETCYTFYFQYTDGDIDAGTWCGGNTVTRADMPALHAFELHLSCSDQFIGGVGEKSNLDGHLVALWSIEKYKDGEFDKQCGGAPNPTATPIATDTPTATLPPTATNTPPATFTPTATNTPPATRTPTPPPTATNTPTPTATQPITSTPTGEPPTETQTATPPVVEDPIIPVTGGLTCCERSSLLHTLDLVLEGIIIAGILYLALYLRRRDATRV